MSIFPKICGFSIITFFRDFLEPQTFLRSLYWISYTSKCVEAISARKKAYFVQKYQFFRKVEKICVHGLNCKIFFSISRSFLVLMIKITLGKNFMSLRLLWNFRKFRNFGNSGDFDWPFWPDGKKYLQFFPWFLTGIMSFLFSGVLEWSDGSTRKCKNGRIGARGLNCEIFIDSEVLFGFND